MKTLQRFRYAALSGVLLIAGYAFAQYPSQDPYPDQDQYQYQDGYQDQYQDQGAYPEQDQNLSTDPPSRVARLQFMRGEVSLQPGGVDEWVDASLNRPLTTADRIWTDRRSLAEMSIGSAVLRVSYESSLQFLNLTDDTAQIELDQGTLHLTVRYLNENEVVEVDTPNVAFVVYEPGEYRFDVYPDSDETAIQIRRGEGEASGRDTALMVYSDYRYLFSDGQSLRYSVGRADRPDDFDRWCARREAEQESSPSAQYVARGTIGYESLDSYGYWEPVPVYGTVWFPDVYAGWAPYRYGHWAWIEPWGWTWVDDAPWGFAPFHYGRWVFVTGRWAWVPGPVTVRPVYAPALVAWIGGTPGFGVSIGVGIGGVGWVPLGWRDPYIPYYHVSRHYARRVNLANSRVVNVTVINNYYSTTNVRVRERTLHRIRYENAQVRGAMTAVSGNVFSSGRPVGKGAVVISPKHAARIRFSARASIVPTERAVLGGRKPAKAPKGWIVPKRVVSRTPPPPPPVRFEHQRPLLEKSKGQPLTWEERTRIRSSKPESAIRHGRPVEVITAPGSRERGTRQKGAPGLFRGVQPSAPPAAGPERREAAPQGRPEAAKPEASPGRSPGWMRPSRPEAAPEAKPERRPGSMPQGRPEAKPEGRQPSPGIFGGGRPSARPANEPPARTMRPPTTPERREAAPPSRPEARPARPAAPSPGARENRPAPPANVPAARTARPSSAPPAREAAPQSQQQKQASPRGRSRSENVRGQSQSQDKRGKRVEDGKNGNDGKETERGFRRR